MNKIFIPLCLLLFTSCASSSFYQVYDTKSVNGKLTSGQTVFEDKNCTVTYNLWGEGGEIGFTVFNKSESDLVIDLNKTFFVLNGVVYDYFNNRNFSQSSNEVTTLSSNKKNEAKKVDKTISTSFSNSYIEKSFLTLPAKTKRFITQYHVVSSTYSSCNLPAYPKSKNIKSLSFEKNNSPFVFYNLISYSILETTSRIENEFYVTEITNFPSKEMFITINRSSCDEKLETPIKVFKNASPNSFYINYAKPKS